MNATNNSHNIFSHGHIVREASKSNASCVSFITYQTGWASALLKPLTHAYYSLHNVLHTRSSLGNWLLKDNLLFFLLAAAGIFLLSPRYLVFIQYLIDKSISQPPVFKPDVSSLPYTPTLIVYALILFIATYFLKRALRIAALLISSLPLLFMYFEFNQPSLGVLVCFLIGAYFFIKLPIKRSFMVMIICTFSLALIALFKQWDMISKGAAADLVFFQTLFLPMLWYSVYEEYPPKRSLQPARFFAYHYARFFGAPLLRYNDLFCAPDKTLAQIRFDGIKALYVVMLAGLTIWGVDKISALTNPAHLTGIPLLLFSYLTYVSFYCQIVIPMNTFVGTMRLFGVPVRDNFHYWLLARTPNEHWRRWNVLFREWVITFIFFPIMRTKRWLFAAVMMSLVTSGVLHILSDLFDSPLDWFKSINTMTYWIINGLAIYLVIKIPLLFPGAVERLKLRTSIVWSIVGVIFTSAFYGILVFMYQNCHNWPEVADYLSRLCTL